MASNFVAVPYVAIGDIEPRYVRPVDKENTNLGIAGISVYAGDASTTIYVSEDAARVIVARLTEILADLSAKVEAA